MSKLVRDWAIKFLVIALLGAVVFIAKSMGEAKKYAEEKVAAISVENVKLQNKVTILEAEILRGKEVCESSLKLLHKRKNALEKLAAKESADTRRKLQELGNRNFQPSKQFGEDLDDTKVCDSDMAIGSDFVELLNGSKTGASGTH